MVALAWACACAEMSLAVRASVSQIACCRRPPPAPAPTACPARRAVERSPSAGLCLRLAGDLAGGVCERVADRLLPAAARRRPLPLLAQGDTDPVECLLQACGARAPARPARLQLGMGLLLAGPASRLLLEAGAAALSACWLRAASASFDGLLPRQRLAPALRAASPCRRSRREAMPSSRPAERCSNVSANRSSPPRRSVGSASFACRCSASASSRAAPRWRCCARSPPISPSAAAAPPRSRVSCSERFHARGRPWSMPPSAAAPRRQRARFRPRSSFSDCSHRSGQAAHRSRPVEAWNASWLASWRSLAASALLLDGGHHRLQPLDQRRHQPRSAAAAA